MTPEGHPAVQTLDKLSPNEAVMLMRRTRAYFIKAGPVWSTRGRIYKRTLHLSGSSRDTPTLHRRLVIYQFVLNSTTLSSFQPTPAKVDFPGLVTRWLTERRCSNSTG